MDFLAVGSHVLKSGVNLFNELALVVLEVVLLFYGILLLEKLGEDVYPEGLVESKELVYDLVEVSLVVDVHVHQIFYGDDFARSLL